MGLGLNAGSDPNFKNYELTEHTYLRIVPSGTDEAGIEYYKENFCQWIIGCGLREVVENFALFLDRIYDASQMISVINLGKDESLAKKSKNSFLRMGPAAKMELLKDEFAIEAPFRELLSTVNQARNCLTHRRGIVGPEDCGKHQSLVVSWRGPRIWAQEPDGKEYDLNSAAFEGVYLPVGGRIKAQLITKSKEFGMGAVVDLTCTDLSEICWYTLQLANAYTDSATQFAIRSGVQVLDHSDPLVSGGDAK